MKKEYSNRSGTSSFLQHLSLSSLMTNFIIEEEYQNPKLRRTKDPEPKTPRLKTIPKIQIQKPKSFGIITSLAFSLSKKAEENTPVVFVYDSKDNLGSQDSYASLGENYDFYIVVNI